MELLTMYQITKTTSKGEVETVESQLSLKQARHLFKGLHKIKCSARKSGALAVTKILSTSPNHSSFSCVQDVDDLYVTTIYSLDAL